MADAEPPCEEEVSVGERGGGGGHDLMEGMTFGRGGTLLPEDPGFEPKDSVRRFLARATGNGPVIVGGAGGFLEVLLSRNDAIPAPPCGGSSSSSVSPATASTTTPPICHCGAALGEWSDTSCG